MGGVEAVVAEIRLLQERQGYSSTSSVKTTGEQEGLGVVEVVGVAAEVANGNRAQRWQVCS